MGKYRFHRRAVRYLCGEVVVVLFYRRKRNEVYKSLWKTDFANYPSRLVARHNLFSIFFLNFFFSSQEPSCLLSVRLSFKRHFQPVCIVLELFPSNFSVQLFFFFFLTRPAAVYSTLFEHVCYAYDEWHDVLRFTFYIFGGRLSNVKPMKIFVVPARPSWFRKSRGFIKKKKKKPIVNAPPTALIAFL